MIDIPQKNNLNYEYVSNCMNYGRVILQSTDYHKSLLIKLLDNASSEFNFNQLICALNISCKYFSTHVISLKIKSRINAWVKGLGKYTYTWSELLDRPNYSLDIFKTRSWPFYNVEHKGWQSIATSQEHQYPNQQDCISADSKKNTDDIKKDYIHEHTISQKYNNFLGLVVMDPVDYPNMDNIILKLTVLNKLGLTLLMYEAILRLSITPATCHIIKQPEMWKLINPIFEDRQFGNVYKKLFYHFMYYAMFILTHEDTVMFSRIKRNYRIIFTHKEALCMPQTYKTHIELDPYIQQLTGDTGITQSIPYYLRCERYIQPINVFERRFFLATGGALANIPLHKFNAAVSGSILIPCLMYCELEKDFKNIRYSTKRSIISNQITFNDDLYKFVDKLTHQEKDFMSYLEYYYPSFHSLTDSEYIEQVLTQPINIVKTTQQLEEKSNKQTKKGYNILSDIDISITADNYETFDELANLLAGQIQRNCLHIGSVWIKKIYTASSFKYKIYGPGLMRPIDLFRVPYGPHKMVKKFHCPIVRSWYDGNNEFELDIFEHNKQIDEFLSKRLSVNAAECYDISYELPDAPKDIIKQNQYQKHELVDNSNYIGVNIIRSCIAAMLSGVNESYKWCFNSKPCIEVILKYAQRGISTILNKREMSALIEYMKIPPRWKPVVKNSIDFIGMMSINHVFFPPSTVDAGIRYKLRKFKESYIKPYNKKQYVAIPNATTEYGANIIIKNNTKVHHPDISKINQFVNYIEQLDQDEFSDGDTF
jgi:hypothetical protein